MMLHSTHLRFGLLFAILGHAFAADDALLSLHGARLSRRVSELHARSDIADLLDKNPSIKALVADYNDLIEPLIQRDAAALDVRASDYLNPAGLRLRSILQRAAGARADAEADAIADADANLELELDGGIGAHGAGAAVDDYSTEKLRHYYNQHLRNDKRTAEPEANVFTNIFQGSMEGAKKNDKRTPEPEANIFTNIFQGSMNGATKNNKRSVDATLRHSVGGISKESHFEAQQKTLFESNANIFTRMFKSGSDFLSSITSVASSFKRKREAKPSLQKDHGDEIFSRAANPEACTEHLLHGLFSTVVGRGLDFLGEYSGIGVGNYYPRSAALKRTPAAKLNTEAETEAEAEGEEKEEGEGEEEVVDESKPLQDVFERFIGD